MIYELKFPSEQRIYKRRIIETNWDKNVRVFNVHPVLGLGVKDIGERGQNCVLIIIQIFQFANFYPQKPSLTLMHS